MLTGLLTASMTFAPAVLAVSCPDNGSLTAPSVTPNSGTPSTNFTFSVTYQDNLGEDPDFIRVFLDGPNPFNRRLLQQSGSLTTGAVFSRTFTVPVGTWSIIIRAQPGTQPAPPATCEVSAGTITVSPPATPTPVLVARF